MKFILLGLIGWHIARYVSGMSAGGFVVDVLRSPEGWREPQLVGFVSFAQKKHMEHPHTLPK